MSESTLKRGVSPHVWGICLVFTLVGAGAFLLADPGADPPFGPSDLEGQLLLGARSLLPGEEIPMGDWAPQYLAPAHVALHTLGFRLFGTSLTTARTLQAVVALLVVLLFFRFLSLSLPPGTSLLAVVLLVVNPIFFGVARTALPEMVSLLLMLLAMLAFSGGRSRGWLAVLSGALFIFAGLINHGPHTIFFLGSGLIMILILRLHAWKMAWRKQTAVRLSRIWAGAVLMILLFVMVVVTHWEQFGATWGHLWQVSPHQSAINITRTPLRFLQIGRMMPITALLALGYFLFFAKDVIRPVARHRQVDEPRLWLLAWLLAGVPYFTVVVSPAPATLVLLVPPVCALAAEAVVVLAGIRRFERPKIDVMIVMLLIAGSVWFLVTWLVHEFLLPVRSGYFARHAIQAALLSVFLFWLVLTYVAGWLYLKWRHATLSLSAAAARALSVLLVLGTVGLGLFAGVDWWGHRGHRTRVAAEALASLPGDAVVAGSWAPLLLLEQAATPCLIWRGLNDTPRAWHSEVTHLLLVQGSEDDPRYSPRVLFPVSDPVQAVLLGPRTLKLYPISR